MGEPELNSRYNIRTPTTLTLLFLVGSLMTLAALATDVMLPAFPAMAVELGVSDAAIQRVLSVFMLGYALPHLIIGSAADRFGRRPILLAGLLVYTVGSVLGVLAQDFGTLLTARFVQGLGAAAGPILARAVLRDLYSGRQLGRMLSFAMIFFTAAPLLAPSIGAILLQVGDYRLQFWFLVAFALVMLALVWRLLPETLLRRDAHALNLAGILANARLILVTPASRWPLVILALTFGVLMAYLGSAPELFINQLGLSEGQFGLQFAVIAAVQFVTQPVNARLLNHYAPATILRFALPAFVLVGFILTAQVALGFASLWTLTVSFMLMFACFSLTVANGTTLVLEPHSKRAGMASGLAGFFQLLTGTILGAVISSYATSGPLALGVGILLLSGLAWLAFLASGLHGRHAPQDQVRPAD